jgi:hypothetical protein
MTEQAFGELAPPENGFDPLDPAHVSPIVVALCADEAQGITGQVFFIYGGSIDALQGWQSGEQFVSEDGWEPDALLGALLDRYPDGVSPDSTAWLKALAASG